MEGTHSFTSPIGFGISYNFYLTLTELSLPLELQHKVHGSDRQGEAEAESQSCPTFIGWAPEEKPTSLIGKKLGNRV